MAYMDIQSIEFELELWARFKGASSMHRVGTLTVDGAELGDEQKLATALREAAREVGDGIASSLNVSIQPTESL